MYFYVLCFLGRVHPDHLVSSFNDDSSKDILSLNNNFIRCCCAMEKNMFNTIFISSNSRNILTAKRLGMNAIAVRGIFVYI